MELNLDGDEFRVPLGEVGQRVTGAWPGGVAYSNDPWVDRKILLAKLEAVLAYSTS